MVTSEISAPGAAERTVAVKIFDWISVGSFEAPVELRVDPLSMVMALTVTGVGFLIHVYSIDYMHGDPRYSRYFAYMNLFVFSMLTLVLANNFVLLYVGWEGVGLCSYLLIAFWFERKAAADAGKKAFIVTRIGDTAMLIGIFLIFSTTGSVRFDEVFGGAGSIASGTATAIALLLFAGAVGKSAQVPLHVWLPDAMAGPTPVSALIHAATMVTAGVYLVVRSAPLFELSGVALTVVLIVGLVTALFAATCALAQVFPLAGFFAKDQILEVASHTGRTWIYLLGTLAALLSALYIGRLLFLAFFGTPRSEDAGQAHESAPVMIVPLVLLAAG